MVNDINITIHRATYFPSHQIIIFIITFDSCLYLFYTRLLLQLTGESIHLSRSPQPATDAEIFKIRFGIICYGSSIFGFGACALYITDLSVRMTSRSHCLPTAYHGRKIILNREQSLTNAPCHSAYE